MARSPERCPARREAFVRIAALAAALAHPAALFAAPSPLAGRWATLDSDTRQKRSVIEIVVTGTEARGRIVELFLQPGEEPDPICEDCPGEARGHRIRGLEILRLHVEADGSGRGTVLDPEEGREYRCVARPSADGKRLELRGYVGLEIFGRSETWTRVD